MRDFTPVYKCLDELEAELNIKEDILPEQPVADALAPCPSIPKAPFPLRDEDGETIITRTAKLINDGKQNPYETNWMDVTLFDDDFTEELLKLIRTDLLKTVGQAISDEETYYDTCKGRFYEIASNYYRCGDGSWYSYPVDTWNNDDEYISPIVIAESIYNQRKKAEEYDKRKAAAANSDSMKKLIDAIDLEFTSLAKGRTVLELIRAAKKAKDFTPFTKNEIKGLTDRLHSIDKKTSIEELGKIAYNEAKSKHITLEEDWFHACERCCELEEENEKLRKKVKESEKHDESYYFCDFVRRYMKSNSRKDAGTRKEVRKSLTDIMTHLKMRLPQELQAALNQFDDENLTTQILEVVKLNTDALLKIAGKPTVETIVVEQNNHGVPPQIANKQPELLND